MRMMIRRLLKRHRYPPEGMDDAIRIVMTQCELWADHADMEHEVYHAADDPFSTAEPLRMIADEPAA